MRDLINLVEMADSRRLANPSKSALKFWITPTGEFRLLDGIHHADDALKNLNLGWHEIFQQGYVRGFYESSTDIMCLDFDQRKMTSKIKRGILKIIRDFNPTTIVWDETRDGAFYSSERLSTKEFIDDLRNMGGLTEAPISDITHIGDWSKNSSYGTQDRKLLTSPKAVTKIKSMWKYPEDVDFNILLINNAEARNHTEVGLVSPDKLANMFPKTISEITPLIRGDQVNIIYTNNKGDQRVPMTGWIMAHRLGHALARPNTSHYYQEAFLIFDRYMNDLMESYGLRKQRIAYSKYDAIDTPSTVKLAEKICTFRAAREGNLRNTMETVHELFAQYLISGDNRMNPIPRYVKWKNTTYSYKHDEEDYEGDCRTIQHDLPYELKSYFETAVHYSTGKILVM